MKGSLRDSGEYSEAVPWATGLQRQAPAVLPSAALSASAPVFLFFLFLFLFLFFKYILVAI